MPITLELRRLGQKDLMFQASLGYKPANLESTMASGRREGKEKEKGEKQAVDSLVQKMMFCLYS